MLPYNLLYLKIPIISPGLVVQKAALRDGLIFGGGGGGGGGFHVIGRNFAFQNGLGWTV